MTTNAAGAGYALRYAAIDLGALDDSVPTARLEGWPLTAVPPAASEPPSKLEPDRRIRA